MATQDSLLSHHPPYQSVVTDVNNRSLKAIMAGLQAAPAGYQFLFALEKLHHDLDAIEVDELWVPIKKMTIGHNMVAFYKAACDEADRAGSDIAKACEEFIAKRVALTKQHRKPGESNRSIVKQMVSAHIYGVTDEEIGSSKAVAKQGVWENKLQSITPYWEIASSCGGPGIFLLDLPRSVDVIKKATSAFRTKMLKHLTSHAVSATHTPIDTASSHDDDHAPSTRGSFYRGRCDTSYRLTSRPRRS